MKYIGIATPCSENFHSMLPNAQGSYCVHCEKNVIDFSVKSDREIIEILQLNDQQCGRFSVEQLERMNKDLDTYSFRSEKSFKSALVFSLFVVFGLSLFSCNDPKQQKEVEAFQKELKETYLSEEPKTLEPEKHLVYSKKNIEEELIVPEVEELFNLAPTDTIDGELDEVIIASKERYMMGGAVSVIRLSNVAMAIQTPIEYDKNGMIIPNEFSSMAFPNPTATNTTLEIKAPTAGEYQIDLYDMNGKLQSAVYSGTIDRGTFQQQIEMGDLTPGMYLVTILSKEYKETVRVSKL